MVPQLSQLSSPHWTSVAWNQPLKVVDEWSILKYVTPNLSVRLVSCRVQIYSRHTIYIILYLFIYSFHCFTKEPHAPHHWSPFRHPGRGGFGLQARDFGGGHVTHSTGGRCLVQEEARKPITTTIDIRGLGLGEWKNISCQNAYKCSFLANPYSAYNFHKSNKPLSLHRRFTRINWRPWLLSSWCSSVRIWTEPVVATTPLGWPLMRRSTLPQKDVQQLYKKDVTGSKPVKKLSFHFCGCLVGIYFHTNYFCYLELETWNLLLLHLKCSIITHQWSWSTRTWRGIAKCLAEGLPDGSQQWRCLGRLGGYRFSALGHFKEARFDQHLKRKNQRKGKTKDDVFLF